MSYLEFIESIVEKSSAAIIILQDFFSPLSAFIPNYYDLIILDIGMPKIDGEQLYQKLRKIDDKLKVCVLSAFGVDE